LLSLFANFLFHGTAKTAPGNPNHFPQVDQGTKNRTNYFLYKILMPLDAAMGKLKERIPWIEGLYCAVRNRRDCLETFDSRSKCRGVRKRRAGFCKNAAAT
jgi:hypothetical protein